MIRIEDLPEEIRRGGNSQAGRAVSSSDEILGEADFRGAKRRYEIAYLKRKLEEYRWNVSRTATAAGVHRQSLQEKLRELRIERPGKEI